MNVSGSFRISKNGTLCAGEHKNLIEKELRKEKTAAKIRFSAAVLIGKFRSDPGISDPPGFRFLYSGQVFSCSGIDLDHIALVNKQRYIYHCASFYSCRLGSALCCVSCESRLCFCDLQFNE